LFLRFLYVTFRAAEERGNFAMLIKSIATIALAAALAGASLSPALAVKRHMPRPTGACANQTGRCIANCDQYNWCQMYACTNGQSTPIPFWRCYEPSGLCFAPRC
jgi:hypothetical protein